MGTNENKRPKKQEDNFLIPHDYTNHSDPKNWVEINYNDDRKEPLQQNKDKGSKLTKNDMTKLKVNSRIEPQKQKEDEKKEISKSQISQTIKNKDQETSISSNTNTNSKDDPPKLKLYTV